MASPILVQSTKMDVPISQLKTDIQVGKNGVTKGLIEHAKQLIKKNGRIKVRILRNALDEDRDVKYHAKVFKDALNVKIIDIRGNTFVLEKT